MAIVPSSNLITRTQEQSAAIRAVLAQLSLLEKNLPRQKGELINIQKELERVQTESQEITATLEQMRSDIRELRRWLGGNE